MGIFAGTRNLTWAAYQQLAMALNDTFVRSVKNDPSKPAGTKYSDGYGFFMHVKDAGKYWRLAYRFAGKQKLLALGTFPEVSLAQARKKETKRKRS